MRQPSARSIPAGGFDSNVGRVPLEGTPFLTEIQS